MSSSSGKETENPVVEDFQEGTTGTPTQLSLPAASDIPALSQDTMQTFKLDALGPMVINADGTLSRIHNWSEMTEVERERTLRILGKRNQLRKDNILAAEDESANGTRTGDGGS